MRRRFNFTQHNSKALEEMCPCQHHLVPGLLPPHTSAPPSLPPSSPSPSLPPPSRSLCLSLSIPSFLLYRLHLLSMFFSNPRGSTERSVGRTDGRTGGDREVGDGSRQWGGTEEGMNNMKDDGAACGGAGKVHSHETVLLAAPRSGRGEQRWLIRRSDVSLCHVQQS